MRQALLGLLFAVIGLALFWGAVLGVVVAYRLEPGDSTPVAIFVLPPIVLGTWTGMTTRRSWIRFGVAAGTWALLLLAFVLPAFLEGGSWDSDLRWFVPGISGATVVALLVRAAGVRWSVDGPPGGTVEREPR